MKNDWEIIQYMGPSVPYPYPKGGVQIYLQKEKTGCRFIETRPQKFANPQFQTAEIWELRKKDWLSIRKP